MDENDPDLTRRCFVIGPIGDKLAEHGTPERDLYEESLETWENVVQPACRAIGLEPLRADKIGRVGEIPEQVCRHLRDDEVVIADLTRANPNVMYELGLRHTTGKITIQIGEKGRLPFDIAAIRTLMFRRTEGGLVEARRQLEQSLQTALQEGQDPVTATRVWTDGATADVSADTQTDAAAMEDHEGFLDTVAAAEEAIKDLANIATELTEHLDGIRSCLEEASEKSRKSDATGGGFAGRLTVANTLARTLETKASTMRPIISRYEQRMAAIAPGIDLLLTRIEREPWGEETKTFLDQMLSFSNAISATVPMSLSFADSLEGLGETSRSLRKATRDIQALLRRYADSSSPAANWIPTIREIREHGWPEETSNGEQR